MKMKAIYVITIFFLIICSGVIFSIYKQNNKINVIKIATAENPDMGYKFAVILQKLVQREHPNIQIEIVQTKGSQENLQLLEENQVNLAVVNEDSTSTTPNTRLMSPLYPQFFHLIVPINSPIQSISDLKNKRVGTPQIGGGSYNSFIKLIKHYELTPSNFATFQNLKNDELIQLFNDGELDAIFGVDILGDKRPETLLSSGKARLIPITQGSAMRLSNPYLDDLIIPTGTYKANPAIPENDLQTLGLQTTLLANKNLSNETVKTIMEIMFNFRVEIFSELPQLSSLHSSFLDRLTTVSLHEGAKAYLNRDKPIFSQFHISVISLSITLITMFVSLLFTFRSYIASKQQQRADQYNHEIIDLMEKVRNLKELDVLDEIEQRLFNIFIKVIKDLDDNKITAESLKSFILLWQQAIEVIRHIRLVKKIEPVEN